MSSTVSDILNEAVTKFISDTDYVLTPTSGGVNNVVQYVEKSNGDKFVLRVYNNGNNLDRVIFEHAILEKLKNRKFSFKIPTTVPSLDGGLQYVPLSNGAQASLFELIPGSLPKLSCVREIGSASAELTNALAEITPQLLQDPLTSRCPTPPYRELFRVHPQADRDHFYAALASPEFDGVRPHADRLAAEVREMEALISQLADLPQQLIHGDLHYDNVLVRDGRVSGLLDFEFCALDWRVMELAVCLSKYAGEPNAADLFEQFVGGYAQHAQLSAEEVAAVPSLVNLRILSNVVYFVARARAGEDGLQSLITRAETYGNRVLWVKANADKIVAMIERHLRG